MPVAPILAKALLAETRFQRDAAEEIISVHIIVVRQLPHRCQPATLSCKRPLALVRSSMIAAGPLMPAREQVQAPPSPQHRPATEVFILPLTIAVVRRPRH